MSSIEQRRPATPTGISARAQQYLDLTGKHPAAPIPNIPHDDIEAWTSLVTDREKNVRAMFDLRQPPDGSLTRSEIDIDGVRTFTLRPPQLDDDDNGPLYIDIHGGGLVMCGGDLAWYMATQRAANRSGTTWAPDYRLPPRYPYPAALDDCLAVYRRALDVRPASRVIVHGESGGSNLAAALLLRARKEGLPMPAGLVLLTPELDLTESGDTFRTNDGVDILSSLMSFNRLYANGHDLSHPYLSPLFGDVTGFPPTFLQSGTRDLFLSNTVRMHRKLRQVGVDAELHVFEAMPHGSFGGLAPEDDELLREIAQFEENCLTSRE